MQIDRMFDMLDDWRNLPAYQLEKRADIFFAIHLERILEHTIGVKVDTIIPEFPVRIGDINQFLSKLNKSYKIDYLAFSKDENKVFLIELKTDLRSRRDDQDNYLKEAQKIKLNGLIGGVIRIYQATSQKVKYNNLLDKLERLEWIKRENGEIKNMGEKIDPTISIIYIQPTKSDSEENVISFDNIIDVLKTDNDSLTARFVESLEKWKIDTNKV